ncbi:hypothetical protein BC628DRAFT_796506 [Trametes gibbosa]|nr:hypothetical protein BC628DRAFT_796506 [Trametes gibbosa]
MEEGNSPRPRGGNIVHNAGRGKQHCTIPCDTRRWCGRSRRHNRRPNAAGAALEGTHHYGEGWVVTVPTRGSLNITALGWQFSRMGSGWALQDLDTNLFLGVVDSAVGENVVMMTDPTTWTVVVVDADVETFTVRLVLPAKGRCVVLDDQGDPKLGIVGTKFRVGPQARVRGELDGGMFKVHDERYYSSLLEGEDELRIGTVGWVSGLLSLSSA